MYKAIVEQEPDPENPRKAFDNLGTMVCFHRKYDLGDEMPKSVGEWLADLLYELDLEYSDPEKPFRAVTPAMQEWVASVPVHGYSWDDFEYDLRLEDREAIDEALARIEASGKIIMLPLYLLDHSGLSIRTSSFGDPWDSGKVGVIYVLTSHAREEFGWKRISEPRRQQIEDILRGEVAEYDAYLRGDCWMWTAIDGEGQVVDGYGGFYDYDEAASEAAAAVARMNRRE